MPNLNNLNILLTRVNTVFANETGFVKYLKMFSYAFLPGLKLVIP